jgi:hypothetical protein
MRINVRHGLTFHALMPGKRLRALQIDSTFLSENIDSTFLSENPAVPVRQIELPHISEAERFRANASVESVDLNQNDLATAS